MIFRSQAIWGDICNKEKNHSKNCFQSYLKSWILVITFFFPVNTSKETREHPFSCSTAVYMRSGGATIQSLMPLAGCQVQLVLALLIDGLITILSFSLLRNGGYAKSPMKQRRTVFSYHTRQKSQATSLAPHLVPPPPFANNSSDALPWEISDELKKCSSRPLFA